MRLGMKPTMGMHLGTVVVAGGWRRAMGEGLLARGSGRLWTDEHGIWFHMRLTSDPLVIPYLLVEDLEVGRCHSGRWAWELPLIKVVG